MTVAIPESYSTLCPVLIGRGPYIEILRQLLAQARLGQGQTVILAGEAGIGKSRLAAEARAMAAQTGFTVLQTSCIDAECAMPYAPVLHLLRRLLRSRPELAEDWAPLGGPLSDLMPEWRTRWAEGEPGQQAEAEQAHASHFAVLSAALTGQGQPLLLVIEDLQWCDEASLEFLLHFGRQLVGQPILLLLTYGTDDPRPELRPLVAELERTKLAVELKLTRLLRADIAFMLRVIFQQARPARPDLVEALQRLTGGNPLFIEEALQTLVLEGAIYRAEGVWTHRPLGEIHLPHTVQACVQRRQVWLSPGGQELSAMAAISGRPLQPERAGALLAAGPDELADWLDELRATQILTVEPDGSFTPRHSLTRQAITSGLLARERQTLHQRMLSSLPAPGAAGHDEHLAELAEHAFQAGQWNLAQALTRRAAERGQALHWPRPAVEHYSRALDAARRLDRPPSPGLYHARGQAYERLGEFEAARLDFEQEGATARLARDRRGEWQSLVDLGFLWQPRDPAQADSYFQQAFRQAYTLNDPVVLSFTPASGSPPDLTPAGLRRGAPAEPDGAWPAAGPEEHALAATLDLLGAASYLSGDVVSGTAYFRRAIALFRNLPDQMGLASSLMHIALGATLDTESSEVGLGEAVRYGEEALELARANGWRAEQAHVLSELAIGYGHQGEYARAFDLAEQGLALASELDHAALIAYALAAQGCLYVDIFAAQEARPILARSLSLAERLPSRQLACFAARFAALAMLECGAEPAEMNEVLQRAESVPLSAEPEADGPRSLAGRCIAFARAQLALAGGEAETALQVVTDLIAPSGEGDTPAQGARRASVALLLLRGAALSALRQPAKAEAALRLAQRAAVEQGALPSLWRVHAALGKHYLRFKQRALANSEFEQARAFIHGLAERIPQPDLREQFLRQARHLAPPAAPPPRPASRREHGVLTERERETVALIAEGKSNREIAGHLVVSEETVKTHVSHILSKLDLRSRTQIAAWAIQHGLTTKG